MIVEAAKVLTFFIPNKSSDSSGQNSAQQQSYSDNRQLHLDQEQLRESLKKITFFFQIERNEHLKDGKSLSDLPNPMHESLQALWWLQYRTASNGCMYS